MNLELTDDASISNSVIYDFNYKSLKKGNDFSKALLMINENSLKILSFCNKLLIKLYLFLLLRWNPQKIRK